MYSTRWGCQLWTMLTISCLRHDGRRFHHGVPLEVIGSAVVSGGQIGSGGAPTVVSGVVRDVKVVRLLSCTTVQIAGAGRDKY